MTAELILAIDVGTQSVRAIIFDLEGNIAAAHKEALPCWDMPEPGWAEQEGDLFRQKISLATGRLWQDNPGVKDRVRCVTLTTQRGTVVMLDKDGRPLYPAVLWMDQRSTRQLPPMPSWLMLLFRLLGQEETLTYLRSQAEVNWFFAHRPDLWEKTHKVLFLSGYLTYLLTGNFLDSVGCQVGYLPFDFKRQCWAKSGNWRWNAFCVSREQLPDLVMPGQLLGRISRTAAAQTGIPAGLPLVAAAGDKACEVLGSGCLEPDQGSISYGTTATINVTSRRYMEPVPLLPPYPSAIPGHYNMEFQIYRGFWLVSWFIQEFGLTEQAAALENNSAPEEIFDKIIATIPAGSEGLLLQPYWSPGLRLPGLEARGSVIGFRDMHTRGHFYRALLEGLAFSLREGKERLEKRTGRKLSGLFVSGGGARSNQVLQITASIFNMPVTRPHTWETSALGAALTAAVGQKYFADFRSATAAMIRYQDAVQPQSAQTAVYSELYEQVYKPLYCNLKPLYKAINKMPGISQQSYISKDLPGFDD